MYFDFCRLYPSSHQSPRQRLAPTVPVISLLFTNAVSPVRACLSICLGRFRGTQKEDERGPLSMQTSLLTLICGPLLSSFLMSFRNQILTGSLRAGKIPFRHPYFILEFGLRPRKYPFIVFLCIQRGLNTKRPTIVLVLTKSREMTGRTQALPWLLGGVGVKTTENKIHWPLFVCMYPLFGRKDTLLVLIQNK